MKIFYHQGVRDFILSTGYKAEIIKKYFIDYYHTKNDIEINHNGEVEIIKKLSENWNIKVIDTGINTDTGGRIKGIKKFINTKKFFVTYGDGLCDINLQKLLKFHNKNKSLVTLTSIKNL